MAWVEKNGWTFNPPLVEISGDSYVKFIHSSTSEGGEIYKTVPVSNYKQIKFLYRFMFTNFQPWGVVEVRGEFSTNPVSATINFYEENFSDRKAVRVQVNSGGNIYDNIFGLTSDFLQVNVPYEVNIEIDNVNKKIRIYCSNLFDTGQITFPLNLPIDSVYFRCITFKPVWSGQPPVFAKLDYVKGEGLK
jgi:hypothetical protein